MTPAPERRSRVDVRSIWKDIAVILSTALIVGIGAWLTVGKGSITRSEAKEMMAEDSPWVKERAGVEQRLRSIEGVLVEIKDELKEARAERAAFYRSNPSSSPLRGGGGGSAVPETR